MYINHEVHKECVKFTFEIENCYASYALVLLQTTKLQFFVSLINKISWNSYWLAQVINIALVKWDMLESVTK